MMRPSFGSPMSARGPMSENMLVSGANGHYQQELDVLQRAVAENRGFMDSVALQTRWRDGLTTPSMEQRMDERSRLMNLRLSAWKEIQDFVYYYRTHFEATVAREVDNYNFYYGYQWDDAEIKRLQKILMVPHVSNYMSRWARTLIGEKRGTQTQFNFDSEDDSKKPVTELYNQVIGKIARANEWNHRSSDAFANLAIAGRCFMSVRSDPYQPFKKLLMQNERYQEFMYDFEHAKDGTLDGCNYLMRTYYRDLEEVIFAYPEWENYLLTYDYAASAGIEQLLQFTIAQPKVPPTAYKRVVETPERFIQRPFFQRRRIAWMTEFQRLEGIRQWVVRDGNFNIEYDIDASDQAAHFYRNLRDASIARNIATTGQAGLDLVTEPMPEVRRVLTTETWCSNVLLNVQTTRVNRFSYVPMHNEFHDGQWRGYFEDDKPNQKMRNKMTVLVDMALGNIKGKSWYHESLFSKESTESQRQEMVRDPMKAMIFKGKPDDVKNLHFTTGATGIDGVMLRQMTEYIEKASNFVNGGLNSVGDAEFAGQSDRLRRGLQESAQTGTVPLMEDWRRAEERVGQHTVYAAQNLHPTVLLEYCNTEDRARFVPLLKSMSHSIEMDAITMSVEEVLSGPTRANQQSSALLEVAGQDPEILQDVMPEIMRLRRFPQTMVDRIEARSQARSQSAGAQAQKEAQLEELQITEKVAINRGKLQIEQGHLEVKRNPPIQFGITGKINAPGPDAMAEIYKQHGIEAEPDKIMASEAKQDLKDQMRDNLRQESSNIRDVPYQTALASLHPAEPKTKTTEGVRSAKDRNNRARKKPEKTTTRV